MIQSNYDYLVDLIQKTASALVDAPIDAQTIELTVPNHQQFGDYTTNICLKTYSLSSNKSYQSAKEFANDLVTILQSHDTQQRIAIMHNAGPGFINFFLSPQALIAPSEIIRHRQDFFHKRVLVEFVGPNTNKQLHIGHLLNATLGHAVVNILRAAGVNTDAGTINNDRGIHIIKSMYSYLRNAKTGKINQTPEGLQTTSTEEKSFRTLLNKWIAAPNEWITPQQIGMKPDHFIGWCYAQGNELAESDEIAQSEMQEMLRAWESGDSDVRSLWLQANMWFYEGYHQTLTTLQIFAAHDGSNFFDRTWYESEIYQKGKDIILANLNQGVIAEFPDGHVEAVLEEKYQIPNLVLLRKDKTALYATQDIELLRSRLKDDKYDQVIYVVDYRQSLQFKQLFHIVSSLGIPEANNCLHLAYGEVRTPQGAMSSRKGNIISADWLIDETTKRAQTKINAQTHDYTPEQQQHIASTVALAAIKYGLLKQNPTSNIIFDIDRSISFEGDTGPYILYTYARAAKIASKATEYNYQSTDIHSIYASASILEQQIIRTLEKSSYYVYRAAQGHTPNTICEYLNSLCQEYNTFYTEYPVIAESDANKRKFRLALTYLVMQKISKISKLIGLQILESM